MKASGKTRLVASRCALKSHTRRFPLVSPSASQRPSRERSRLEWLIPRNGKLTFCRFAASHCTTAPSGRVTVRKALLSGRNDRLQDQILVGKTEYAAGGFAA